MSDYDELCPVCNLPIAYHGILGVVFCSGCGGPLRVRCEMDIGSAGFQMAARPEGSPPVGDGGPSFPEAVWSPTPHQADLDALEEPWGERPTETCLLCGRELPIRAFHYSEHERERDYGGWRCSRWCRRCTRAWLESLGPAATPVSGGQGGVEWDRTLQPVPTG